MSKPTLSIYTFKFVVRANSWDDVVSILKDELGITKKRNSSDRKISGLYLVSCIIDDKDITKNFYKKIAKSNNIVIHSDGKSTSLYPKILKETQIVEEKLRWLLLHVSDAIEDYVKLLGYEKNDIVENSSLDPLTSKLSFETILDLLEIDQSWARDGVDDGKMRHLIKNSSDFATFKSKYIEKTTPKTVWGSISDLVLERPIKWETIYKKLHSIRILRNKCAHFHTVTSDDFSQAKHLRTQIMKNLTKKSSYTSTDIKTLTELSKQMVETVRTLQTSYYKDIAKLTNASFSAQQALANLSGGAYQSPSIAELAKSVTRMVNKMYAPVFSSDYYKLASRMPVSGLKDNDSSPTKKTGEKQ